ncbi:uncharacterized protein FMAN_10846 [Fusarium mangiferae]|uniref:Uncharacterized protein n=1 Tax=Fusarium mangiferae TaxID=192010 RepID=A0A1L7UAC8_FUSMA|nr:uncharacterized protein FMAN_10846 [Fusarium mangiferae]CVL05293.1 uncharacterized protein FMAN_10846 [Fusarium mangiferae]
MLLSSNRNDLSLESLQQSQVDMSLEFLDGDATNLEQLLECYQTGKECAHPAVSFDVTTSHRPDRIDGPERASEASFASSPSHPRDPPTAGYALTRESDDRLPRPTSVHTSTQLQKLPLVFAVEVSSTSEKIFQREKNTISYIASKLEPKELADQSHILPWDRQAHDPVPANLIGNLQHSVGSNPSSIFDNHLGRKCLEQSKIWFLMTDGVIEEERANAFTNKLVEAGLHGTPSVIIVFGNRSRPPSRSKLSIGMSICAPSPHCAVLFHDVWSNEPFIVQAKGCFASLLPKGSYFKWFSGTKWTDFPQTSYDRLLRVRAPQSIRLSKDEVALPYGRVFDMKSIYNDSMSDQDKLQLVSNNSALDAIMVVARTRGEGFLVKLWIESLRRTTTTESFTIERDDVDSRGITAMGFLLMAAEQELEAPNTRHKDIWSCLTSVAPPRCSRSTHVHGTSHLDFHRASVRLQNKRNWANFEAKVEIERAALGRVTKGLQEVQSAIGILDDPSPNDPSLATANTFWYPASGLKTAKDNEKLPASVLSKKLDKQDVDKSLFLSGFKGTRKLEKAARSRAYATCSICREPNSIQTLLLRTSPKDNKTPHLPLPNERLQLKCPLALGNCPEVDILLPLTCCDGCALLLLRTNKQANPLETSHRIAAALPLVSLQDKQNRRLWRQTLAEVFRHRFHDSTVLSVFLATICAEIENVPSLTRSKSLKWCRDELSRLPGIHVPQSSSPKLVTSLPSAVDNMVPPQQVAFFACLGNKFYLKAVLSQPVEGFVVLVQLATSMNVVEPEAIRNLVWKRLLCHFIKQDLRLRTNFGIKYAYAMLQEIVQESPSSSHGHHGKFVIALPKQRTSISLTSLVNTYFIPPESSAISHFFRIPCFGELRSTTEYDAALAMFLHILASIEYHGEEATDILEEMNGVADKLRHVGEDMRSVFEDPTSVEESGAAYVIAHLESWLNFLVSSN